MFVRFVESNQYIFVRMNILVDWYISAITLSANLEGTFLFILLIAKYIDTCLVQLSAPLISWLLWDLDFIFLVSDIGDDCMNLSCITGIDGRQFTHNSLSA